MADYKQLKTITIGGETFGLVEGLGVLQTKNTSKLPYTGGWVDTDTITLEKDQTYLVGVLGTFATGDTTGIMRHSVKITTSFGAHQEITLDANQASVQKSTWRVFTPSIDNYTVYASAESSKAISGGVGVQVSLNVVKLLRIPTT